MCGGTWARLSRLPTSVHSSYAVRFFVIAVTASRYHNITYVYNIKYTVDHAYHTLPPIVCIPTNTFDKIIL